MPGRRTQAQTSYSRSGVLTLARAEQSLRSELVQIGHDKLSWVQHLAVRLNVPVAQLLRLSTPELEREIALAIADTAEAMAQRAIADKTIIPAKTDMLHQLATRVHTRLKAVELAKAKAEQAEQMAAHKAELRERGLL